MRGILERCIEIDRMAEQVYARLAAGCEDESLVRLFSEMEAEEREHQGWWHELLEAYLGGLLPDIIADPEGLAAELDERISEMRAIAPDAERPTCEDPLNTALRLEFFTLDPVFGELIELLEPGSASSRHRAYLRHLERLIKAIEQHYDDRSVETFLARILRRVWRDTHELARHANTDPLTGLLNRRALNAQLTQWAAWSARYDRPLAVLLMDLDRFKGINDGEGHIVGDSVLTAVARALEDGSRDADLLARYGGDEFALVAPEADEREALALAERVLDEIRAVRVMTPTGKTVGITGSIGVAITTPSDDTPGDRPVSPDSLLSAADRSLYAAKERGGDRVGEPASPVSRTTAASD